jgi:hypothetical protein
MMLAPGTAGTSVNDCTQLTETAQLRDTVLRKIRFLQRTIRPYARGEVHRHQPVREVKVLGHSARERSRERSRFASLTGGMEPFIRRPVSLDVP